MKTFIFPENRKACNEFDEQSQKGTLEVYSISANLKAMPSEPNRTETKEHASQKGFKRSSMETPLSFLIKSDSSSNASEIKERAVPVSASSNSSSSKPILLIIIHHKST